MGYQQAMTVMRSMEKHATKETAPGLLCSLPHSHDQNASARKPTPKPSHSGVFHPSVLQPQTFFMHTAQRPGSLSRLRVSGLSPARVLWTPAGRLRRHNSSSAFCSHRACAGGRGSPALYQSRHCFPCPFPPALCLPFSHQSPIRLNGRGRCRPGHGLEEGRDRCRGRQQILRRGSRRKARVNA